MHIIRLSKGLKTNSEFFVVRWCKEAGESIEKGDILCILRDSSQSLEFESPSSGVILEILTPAGAIVFAGEPMGYIGKEGEDTADAMSKLQAQQLQEMPETNETAELVFIDPGSEEIAKHLTEPVATTTSTNQVIPILMPQAGQSMEEGTILEWKVKPGDYISQGQVILEIETDKAAMEVEAPDSGRLARIIAAEGTIVEVKEPIAYLADNDADVDAYLAARSQTQPSTDSNNSEKTVETKQQVCKPQDNTLPKAVTQTSRVKASPAARKIAAQKAIDIGSVATGSGPGGRILSTDVLKAKPETSQKQRRPLSKMRRAIARNLQYSKQNIPHFYIKATVNAQSLFHTYQQTKQQFKCSINDFVTLACAKTICQFPAFRSQYVDDELLVLPSINIGIAVGTDEGLTVPVLLDAEKMDLQTIALRSRELIENARSGKLEGIGQGIFTITNMGMFGVEEFSAIINPPESAILAVGAIREGIMVNNAIAQPTRLMTLCLSVDHRVIDGVMAAQYIGALKERLESPEQLTQ